MQQNNHAGVLSQTLASSPCITQVLPARVRDVHHNDVVMVGHSSIQLREFRSNGSLSNVLARLELGTQILSANVISADVNEDEGVHPVLAWGVTEIHFSINGEPYDPTQPPQIVVLATALSELVFAYARHLPNGTSQFVYARRFILHTRNWPRKYGRHLAVDSKSRAFAVANMKGSFAFFGLKNVKEIKNSIDTWDPRDPGTMLPFTEQVFTQVDGTILRMDFLKSPVDQPQRVILLLIVANRGATRLLLYKWDSWQGLTDLAALQPSGYLLPAEDAFPHLLIPSVRPCSFAIVTAGDRLVFYDNITSGNRSRGGFRIPQTDEVQKDKESAKDQKYSKAQEDQKDKKDSKQQRNTKNRKNVRDPKDMIWVQWAKPVRHETHRLKKEDIFLIREDGTLKTAIVTHDSQQRVHVGFSPGELHIRVDTAVCALPNNIFLGGDVLIVCGDTTEGGVWRLVAKQYATKVQSLANWSPMTDVAVLKKHNTNSASTESVRVLAATGIYEDRAHLTELQYGVESQIVEAIEHQDATTVDRLWVLHQRNEDRQLLLTSHHEHSDVFCFERDLSAPFAVGPEIYPSLGFDSPTLAACNIDLDSILQITTSDVHVLGDAWQLLEDRSTLRGRHICAHIDPHIGIFVIASRSEQSLHLILGVVVRGRDQSISITVPFAPHVINHLPISFAIASVRGRQMLITGSLDGCLHLFFLNNEQGITPYKMWHVSSFHRDLSDAKISSVSILALPNSPRALVICGFKTGQAMFFELTILADDMEPAGLSLIRLQAFGCTAVATTIEEASLADDEAAAFLTCDSEIFQVRLYHNSGGVDFTVSPLIITAVRQHHEVYRNPSFNAIAYVAKATPGSDELLSGVLVGFTVDAFLIIVLGESALVPKPISRIRPTHHVVQSTHLQKLVASVAVKKNKSSVSADIVKPEQDKPSLQMLDSDLVNPAGGKWKAPPEISFGECGERIRALLHWAPTNGQTHYEMIVVGSEYDGDGRLSYITAKRLSQAEDAVVATTFITYPKKTINAICEYGLSSLLVCAGRVLKLVHLDLSTKPPRWEHHAEIELPSRATELKAKGSVVYVATSLHSYMLIREHDKEFHVIGSDRWAGRARNILPYGDGPTLVNLVSDNGSRIMNFAERPVQDARPTFEALVPEAIDKLIQLTSSSAQTPHDRFLGTTIDGTVYLFTTLNEAELKLLSHLERLCQPAPSQAEISVVALADRLMKQHANVMEAKGVKMPRFNHTHAHGDVLKALLKPGVYNIRMLLRQSIKMETDTFDKTKEGETLEDIARPVLGRTEDTVAAIVLWLRKLLHVPLY